MTSISAALVLAQQTQQPAQQTGPDWLMIGMVVILAVLVFFMFRNSRKRKREMEELQSAMVPGVEVMTNFGLYGTIRSIDTVGNTAEIEIAPATVIKVHRQTLARVVESGVADGPRSVEEAMEIANREQAEREAAERAAAEGEPKFGERIADDAEGDAPDADKKA